MSFNSVLIVLLLFCSTIATLGATGSWASASFVFCSLACAVYLGMVEMAEIMKKATGGTGT